MTFKDVRTSLKKLAEAYHTSLDELDLRLIETTYKDTLASYFAGLQPPASAHTQRNTYQNLAQFYRQAGEASLLRIRWQDPTPGPRGASLDRLMAELRDQSPYRQPYRSSTRQQRYKVPLEQWPVEIRQQWGNYAAERALELRPETRQLYANWFGYYMSYNLKVEQPPITSWAQVFERARIARCLTWLAERVGAQHTTKQGMNILILLINIAQHQERPEYAALYKWKRRLAKPTDVLDKQLPRHTASLIDLDGVGATLMSEARYSLAKHPHGSHVFRAVRFETGLIIRLLVRCPRRSREIREMDLGGRLYQDDQGVWQLAYRSDQLKIDTHDGRPNEFRMAWPADLVGDLEEYLRDHRPRLPNSATSRLVFLTGDGNPLHRSGLAVNVKLACYRLLGKHIYPHLFRTLWCDAYLDAHPGDWEGAAAMLNDTPETVRGWYRQFRVQQHLKKGIDFNAQLFGQRKGISR